jgi:hypothetical protein
VADVRGYRPVYTHDAITVYPKSGGERYLLNNLFKKPLLILLKLPEKHHSLVISMKISSEAKISATFSQMAARVLMSTFLPVLIFP